MVHAESGMKIIKGSFPYAWMGILLRRIKISNMRVTKEKKIRQKKQHRFTYSLYTFIYICIFVQCIRNWGSVGIAYCSLFFIYSWGAFAFFLSDQWIVCSRIFFRLLLCTNFFFINCAFDTKLCNQSGYNHFMNGIT